MHKQITIVIPCFNQGHFLKDALDSISQCNADLYDVIIVNDGSTDTNTIKILNDLVDKGYHVVFQQNKGLGIARNTGIELAQTKYILPLDADNKITPQFLIKALDIFNINHTVAVVYGNAKLFGDKSGISIPGAFNLQKLMLGNYIDACAVIKKSVLVEVGMYDSMKIMGYEDWDLWLRIAFAGHTFFYLNEVVFEYRVTSNSMMKSVNESIERQNQIEDYFTTKYADKLDFELVLNRMLYQFKSKPLQLFTYLFLRKYFPVYFNKCIEKHKIRKNFIYD